jgi:hypothetical protein
MKRVIALWGPARSLSTTMVKAFEQRGDCAVEHEPFNDCYYFSTGRVTGMYGDKPDLLGYDGRQAEARILAGTQDTVFFKDMAYLALPYLSEGFLRSCVNTFIIRDPRLTLRSRKKLRSEIGEFEFGFTALWTLWNRVVGDLGQKPVVIDGEQLRMAPTRVLAAYCAAVGLAYQPKMSSWQAEPLRPWQAHEMDAQSRWHRTLETSTGFVSETEDADSIDYDFTDNEWRMVNHAMRIYKELRRHTLSAAG